MKFNKDKNIGRVLFIVEGSKTEFSILKRIFCNILKYNYIAKKRNRLNTFVKDELRLWMDLNCLKLTGKKMIVGHVSDKLDIFFELFELKN